MLTNLYHGECDNGGLGTGTATIGSSEAIMLGGLAMKKAWQAKRKAAGKPYDKPNLVSSPACPLQQPVYLAQDLTSKVVMLLPSCISKNVA